MSHFMCGGISSVVLVVYQTFDLIKVRSVTPSVELHTMDPRSACIQGVLKVKVEVKGHVKRALSWILGMSYSVIDGLVIFIWRPVSE